LTDRNSYIITAGTDKTIRFWDLKEPKGSKIISGPKRENKVPVYTSSQSKDIDIIQENWIMENDKINLNLNRNMETNHSDCILDLKFLEPYNMLVTSSRDCVIKVWK
jgi:WD40 repeat protein